MPAEYMYSRIQNMLLLIGNDIITQLTSTCSKLTIEALEKGVKYVQS